MSSVLFLSVMNGAAWGGSEELWYHSALWTVRHGIETAVCCFDWPGKKGKIKQLEEAGCTVLLLPGKRDGTTSPFLRDLRIRRRLAKVPFEKYDKVIVNQGGWKDLAYDPFKKLFTRLKDFIIIYHNYNANERLSATRATILQHWVNRADQNTGVTLEIFRVMEDVYKLKIPRKEKLFNPLTIDIPKVATAYPVIKHGNYILSVLAALDTERKAQDILLKSLAHPSWQNRNWELHLYGEGKDKALLKELVAALQLQEKVFVHGNAVNYQEAVRESNLVLQITHIDAMPISVIEAMAMARPLVVSKVGDMPIWVKENINGWVTDSVTVDAVQQVLEKAWQHRKDWEKMGEASYSIFRKNFPVNPVEYFLRQAGIIQ